MNRDMKRDMNIEMDIEIIGSFYGAMSRISNPTTHISVIGEDGRLIDHKWAGMCRRMANNGATGLREMPFWLEKYEDHIFAPFFFEDGTFNLARFNPLYFENLRRMAEIANRFNLKFYLSLYEHCNTRKKNNLRPFVPWTNSRQNLKNAWYGSDADGYRRNWERKVFETLDGLKVGYELCNEPEGDFTRFLLITYLHAVEAGIKDKDIIPGIN